MNKIFDLHNDFLTTISSDRKKQAFLLNKKNQSVTDIISAVWTSKMNPENAIKNLYNSYSFINGQNKEKTKNKPNLRLAIEDLHFLSRNYLYEIINFNPVYCSLTWNNDNNLAGGAKDGGDLTNFGIEVIRELEKNKIVIDTAHLSEKSFMSFAKITEKPILCSHCAVANIVNNNRNLKDYQMRMIIESEGLIGITFVPEFLSNDRNCNVNDICRHIDYIVCKFGDRNVSIGTDFYGTKRLPKNIKNYKNIQLIEDKLMEYGYSDKSIQNIFYNNANKFFNL